MANSRQAIKRAKQGEKHRLHNTSQKSAMRSAIKKTLAEIKAGGKDKAQAAFKQAVVLIDRMVNRNIIHMNKAARLKSRLNKKIKAA